MPRIARCVGIIAGLMLLLAFPPPASAQYSAEDEQNAIDAVTSFLIEMGDKKSAEVWKDGWNRGIYTFKRLDGDTQAQASAGSERIEFSENMMAQLDPRRGPQIQKVADWAATFHHELVHTKQGKVGWAAAEWSHLAKKGHSHEAAAWGRGFESYWRWLKIATANHAKARTEEERQKFANQIVGFSESFLQYFNDYKGKKFGPLPREIGFSPLGGTDTTPLTLEEAVREAGKLNKSIGDNLRLAVRLSKTTYRVKAGEEMILEAHPKNSWNKPSFSWKAGSKLLPEKSATLTRKATVDETITVTIQDNRNQKASASCDVIVEKPVVEAKAPTPTAPKTPEAKKPAKGEYAWVYAKTRTNDWQERLDRRNKSMNGYWTHTMSVSDSSVTITNTYTGNRSDNWAKNGMSNSGTATWTEPSKTIRPGDVVSVGLTTVNAPRSHANFGPVILINVQTYRLGKDGKPTGSSSYFADEKGKDDLGSSRSQTKAPEAMTVFRKFGAGGAEGEKMAIRVTAQGESESVQTEYIYEWKKF